MITILINCVYITTTIPGNFIRPEIDCNIEHGVCIIF